MVSRDEIYHTILDAKSSASNKLGFNEPGDMNEYNHMSDTIFDYLNNKLPSTMKFRDVVSAYHLAENDSDIAAEQFRILMERKFGSKIY